MGEAPMKQEEGSSAVPISSLPQKRPFEEDHLPAVSSPLNPDFKPSKPSEEVPANRERRTKKESLKKRESKVTSDHGRAASEPRSGNAMPTSKSKKGKSELAPMRYKLPPPKSSDFDVPRGPSMTLYEEKFAADGRLIAFNETGDQYVTITLKLKHG